jgi:hypothetical protein
MPQRPDITAREVKQFLRLEQMRHKTTPNAFRKVPIDPERMLHKHNAEDVHAAVLFIEKHASEGLEVAFPAELVDELKAALPHVAPSGETVERMATILDVMQASVTSGEDRAALDDPVNRASNAFHRHRQYSKEKRAEGARQRGKRRR